MKMVKAIGTFMFAFFIFFNANIEAKTITETEKISNIFSNKYSAKGVADALNKNIDDTVNQAELDSIENISIFVDNPSSTNIDVNTLDLTYLNNVENISISGYHALLEAKTTLTNIEALKNNKKLNNVTFGSIYFTKENAVDAIDLIKNSDYSTKSGLEIGVAYSYITYDAVDELLKHQDELDALTKKNQAGETISPKLNAYLSYGFMKTQKVKTFDKVTLDFDFSRFSNVSSSMDIINDNGTVTINNYVKGNSDYEDTIWVSLNGNLNFHLGLIPVLEISDTKPEIRAKDVYLNVNDTFDEFKDVSAFDEEDGDITNKLEVVKNTVDISKAGQYYVVYRVEDSDGNISGKTINVYVKELSTNNSSNSKNDDTDIEKDNSNDSNNKDINKDSSSKDNTKVPTTGSTIPSNLYILGLLVTFAIAGLLINRKRIN